MIKKIMIAPVRFYQRFISPAFPPSCRFRPTCSNYMIEAIEKHGAKGLLMGLARIGRCHPWSEEGTTQCRIILASDEIILKQT